MIQRLCSYCSVVPKAWSIELGCCVFKLFKIRSTLNIPYQSLWTDPSSQKHMRLMSVCETVFALWFLQWITSNKSLLYKIGKWSPNIFINLQHTQSVSSKLNLCWIHSRHFSEYIMSLPAGQSHFYCCYYYNYLNSLTCKCYY